MLPELNLSRRTKRSKMFKDVDFAISKYKDSLMSDFVPVLIEDFGGTTSVKMTGMRMEKPEIEKIKEFGIKIGKSALESYKKDLEINVGRVIEEYNDNQQKVGTLHDELGKIYNIIERNHIAMTRDIDCYIKEVILKTVKDQTLERSKLEARIYNFTNVVIEEDIEMMFKLGMDAVPSLGLTIFEIKKRVNEALLEYLNRYRVKYSWSFIHHVEVLKWRE